MLTLVMKYNQSVYKIKREGINYYYNNELWKLFTARK